MHLYEVWAKLLAKSLFELTQEAEPRPAGLETLIIY